MSNLDSEMIAQKLSRTIERIDRLKKLEELTLNEYLQDDLKQAAIERLIEIVIDSALSINKTLLKRVAGIVPADHSKSFKNFGSFILIGENGFIPQQLAEQLAPSSSFRNILAHQYDDIDPIQVYTAFQKMLNQYPQYVKAIQTYLDTLEED